MFAKARLTVQHQDLWSLSYVAVPQGLGGEQARREDGNLIFVRLWGQPGFLGSITDLVFLLPFWFTC